MSVVVSMVPSFVASPVRLSQSRVQEERRRLAAAKDMDVMTFFMRARVGQSTFTLYDYILSYLKRISNNKFDFF